MLMKKGHAGPAAPIYLIDEFLSNLSYYLQDFPSINFYIISNAADAELSGKVMASVFR